MLAESEFLVGQFSFLNSRESSLAVHVSLWTIADTFQFFWVNMLCTSMVVKLVASFKARAEF